MNNTSVSTKDHKMTQSDSDSNMEILEPKRTVTLKTNADKIEQLVSQTSTNTTLKIKQETISNLVTPFSAESTQDAMQMKTSQKEPWITVKSKRNENKEDTSKGNAGSRIELGIRRF